MKRLIVPALLIATSLLTGCAAMQDASDSLCCYSRTRAAEKVQANYEAQQAREAADTAAWQQLQQARDASMSQGNRPRIAVYSCDRDEVSRAQCRLSDMGIETEITHQDGMSWLSDISAE